MITTRLQTMTGFNAVNKPEAAKKAVRCYVLTKSPGRQTPGVSVGKGVSSADGRVLAVC